MRVEAANSVKVPKPRAPKFNFDSTIPRHWLAGNATATHLSNAINLLFPPGERFFVRSVLAVAKKLPKNSGNEKLLEQVRGFAGQEGRHAQAHEHFDERLMAQGFRISGFLRFYEWLGFSVIEPAVPASVRLAVTVACEHYTATLAEGAFKGGDLNGAHPVMRDLLLWHAAEEIEHRAVAFDVLQRAYPSRLLRAAGLAIATTELVSFWMIAFVMLLWQDDEVDFARFRRELSQMLKEDPNILGLRLGRYLATDFHPSENAMDALAETYLTEKGLA